MDDKPKGGVMDQTTGNLLIEFVQWAWVSFTAFLVHVYRRLNGLDSKQALLEQQQANFDKQMEKEAERFEVYRKEQRESARVIYDKLDALQTAVLEGKSGN